MKNKNLILSICEIVRESGGWLQPAKKLVKMTIFIYYDDIILLRSHWEFQTLRTNLWKVRRGYWHWLGRSANEENHIIRANTKKIMEVTSSCSELTINWMPSAPEKPSRSARILIEEIKKILGVALYNLRTAAAIISGGLSMTQAVRSWLRDESRAARRRKLPRTCFQVERDICWNGISAAMQNYNNHHACAFKGQGDVKQVRSISARKWVTREHSSMMIWEGSNTTTEYDGQPVFAVFKSLVPITPPSH